MEYNRDWGVHAFDVPVGRCTVSIACRLWFWDFGRKTIDIPVRHDENAFVDYAVVSKFGFHSVSIRKATLAEGLGWKTAADFVQPSAKWTASQTAVILGVVLLGPIGLLPLWKSSQFSTNIKITITAVIICIFVLLFAKL